MQVNADLIARHMLRMAAEIESLAIVRDALAEENDRLKTEVAQLGEREASPGPRAVPSPDPDIGHPA